jgi:hypothetical protein
MKLRRNRHPLLQDWPQGEWCPDAVGVVSGYPRTAEAYAAQAARCRTNREGAIAKGILNRHGVPNGWAGRKDELADIRRNSRTEAERLTEAVFEPDCREARMAMEAAMEFVVSPLTLPRDRIVGMRTVLEFTVPKPVQVAVLTGGDALGFLRQLADVRTTREATKRG